MYRKYFYVSYDCHNKAAITFLNSINQLHFFMKERCVLIRFRWTLCFEGLNGCKQRNISEYRLHWDFRNRLWLPGKQTRGKEKISITVTCVPEWGRKVLMAKNQWKLEGRLQTVKCNFCIMRHKPCHCAILNKTVTAALRELVNDGAVDNASYVALYMLEWLVLWFKASTASWVEWLRWIYLKIAHKRSVLHLFHFIRMSPSI
jgi:hypothetical protein